MPRVDLIKPRGGTAAVWADVNPVLAFREEGFETDTGRSKFGNGATAWNDLAYAGTGTSGVGVGDCLVLRKTIPADTANGYAFAWVEGDIDATQTVGTSITIGVPPDDWAVNVAGLCLVTLSIKWPDQADTTGRYAEFYWSAGSQPVEDNRLSITGDVTIQTFAAGINFGDGDQLGGDIGINTPSPTSDDVHITLRIVRVA